MIDPIKRAIELRSTLKRGEELLVVDFSNTLQGKDTSKIIDLMPNVRTGEYVFRAKVNVKEIDPIAMKDPATGGMKKDFFDVRARTDAEIENFIKRAEFDFPLWFKHHPLFSMKRALDYNPPFIVQVAGCNFHDGSETGGCWYCFVDDKSNDGVVGAGKTYLHPIDAVRSMTHAQNKVRDTYKALGFDLDMNVFRVSGGEPTLALDFILDAWRNIAKNELPIVGQIDTNLSTGRVVEAFEREGIYEKNILQKLATYPIKVLTAIKGVDERNIGENVQASLMLQDQMYSLEKIVGAGFDIYPQMYNPDPKKLTAYLDMLEERIPNISMRIHIGPLKVYGPTAKRLQNEAKKQGVDIAEMVRRKTAEWDDNYKQGCEVLDQYLRKRHGVGYRDVTRSDIPLRLRK